MVDSKRPQNKPRPTISLIGEDGNAFNVMGIAAKALKRAGYTKEEVDQYTKEAMAGDYNNLLAVTNEWCEIE